MISTKQCQKIQLSTFSITYSDAAELNIAEHIQKLGFYESQAKKKQVIRTVDQGYKRIIVSAFFAICITLMPAFIQWTNIVKIKEVEDIKLNKTVL